MPARPSGRQAVRPSGLSRPTPGTSTPVQRRHAWDAWDAARLLGEMLARLVQAAGEPVLLLASSDMNHYEPAGVTEQKDAQALEAIRALDGAELLARCRRERISMCGRGPAATVIAAARVLGAERAEVVDYRHAGWVSGG